MKDENIIKGIYRKRKPRPKQWYLDLVDEGGLYFDVIMRDKSGEEEWFLLSIARKDGRVYLQPDLPRELGIPLNNLGQVKLINN